jgi:uncharacterized membrane protein
VASLPWASLHGASTHFPVALTIAALGFDSGALFFWRTPFGARLRQAGAAAIAVSALGSIAAVVSGLLLTKGQVWGAGALGWHHRMVWPAFALIVSAAAWRVQAGEEASLRSHAAYVGVLFLASALVGAAGYFGGQMLHGLS